MCRSSNNSKLWDGPRWKICPLQLGSLEACLNKREDILGKPGYGPFLLVWTLLSDPVLAMFEILRKDINESSIIFLIFVILFIIITKLPQLPILGLRTLMFKSLLLKCGSLYILFRIGLLLNLQQKEMQDMWSKEDRYLYFYQPCLPFCSII